METVFFATKSDLEDSIQRLESGLEVEYVRTGLFDSREYERKHTLMFLPELGLNPSGAVNLAASFLIVHKNSEIRVRSVAQRKGWFKFAIDQLENQETVQLRLSGMYDEHTLLPGRIAIAKNNEAAKTLYNSIRKLFCLGYKDVKGWKIGPEALKLFEQGCRLTVDVNSPPQYDLRLP